MKGRNNVSKRNKTSGNDTAKKIALGATGVALTAGAVAAGVVLMNKRNRDNMSKGAKKAIGTLKVVASDFAKEQGGRYNAVAHELATMAKKKLKKTSKSKSKK